MQKHFLDNFMSRGNCDWIVDRSYYQNFQYSFFGLYYGIIYHFVANFQQNSKIIFISHIRPFPGNSRYFSFLLLLLLEFSFGIIVKPVCDLSYHCDHKVLYLQCWSEIIEKNAKNGVVLEATSN